VNSNPNFRINDKCAFFQTSFLFVCSSFIVTNQRSSIISQSLYINVVIFFILEYFVLLRLGFEVHCNFASSQKLEKAQLGSWLQHPRTTIGSDEADWIHGATHAATVSAAVYRD
jgi:hypothetical protein